MLERSWNIPLAKGENNKFIHSWVREMEPVFGWPNKHAQLASNPYTGWDRNGAGGTQSLQ